MQYDYEKMFMWLIEQHYIEPEIRFRLDVQAHEDDFISYTKEVLEKISQKVKE